MKFPLIRIENWAKLPRVCDFKCRVNGFAGYRERPKYALFKQPSLQSWTKNASMKVKVERNLLIFFAIESNHYKASVEKSDIDHFVFLVS